MLAKLKEQHGKDQVEKAFHSISRRIVAGTSYCLDGSPGKDAWVEDFKLLFKGHFEGYWNPNQAFPATGGRDFLAGMSAVHNTCVKLVFSLLLHAAADLSNMFFQVYMLVTECACSQVNAQCLTPVMLQVC